MRKAFLKIVTLMSLLVILLFAGGACSTTYTYSETFGSTNGCGCATNTNIKGNYGTQDKLEAMHVSGSFAMTCNKDSDGYVKSFTYTVEVKGFDSDLSYSRCSVGVTVYYNVIDYDGDVNSKTTSTTVVLNGRGDGKQTETITVSAMDVKIKDVKYTYNGTVTHI